MNSKVIFAFHLLFSAVEAASPNETVHIIVMLPDRQPIYDVIFAYLNKTVVDLLNLGEAVQIR